MERGAGLRSPTRVVGSEAQEANVGDLLPVDDLLTASSIALALSVLLRWSCLGGPEHFGFMFIHTTQPLHHDKAMLL